MATVWDITRDLVRGFSQEGTQVSEETVEGLDGLGLDLSGAQAEIAAMAGLFAREDPPLWDGEGIVKRSEARVAFYDLDDDDLTDFQERAFAAGLYGTNNRARVRFGDRDEATFAIWEAMVDRAVGYHAVGQKVSPLDAFNEAAKVQTGFEETRQPLVTTVSNPVDIKEAMREAAKDAIGRGSIDEAKLDEIVARWQGMERHSQQEQYDLSETGGTRVAPPSFETFAENEARKIDPTAADAYKVMDKFSVMMERFGGANA